MRYKIKTLLIGTTLVAILFSMIKFQHDNPTISVDVAEIMMSQLHTLDLGESESLDYLIRVSGAVSGRVAIETDSDRMIVGPGDFDEIFNESTNGRYGFITIHPQSRQQGTLAIEYRRKP